MKSGGARWLFGSPLNVLTVAVVGAVMYQVISEHRQGLIILDPIEVPKDVSDAGYTPQVLTQRINDAWADLNTKAKTSMNRPFATLSAAQVDLEIPSTGFSIHALNHLVTTFLRLPETRIGGDVTRDGQGFLLVLRNNGSAIGTAPIRAAAPLDLVQPAAEAIAKAVEPYVLASYFFDEKHNAAMAIEIIQYCLANPPADDDWRANLLWGLALRDQKHDDEALAKFDESLKLKPDGASALNQRGLIFDGQGKLREAIDEYKKALAVDVKPADVAVLKSDWCKSLNDLGQHDEALARCREAIAADSKNMTAHHNAGVALEGLTRYKDALAEYKTARMLDSSAPKHPEPCDGWSRVLARLNPTDHDTSEYQQACGAASR